MSEAAAAAGAAAGAAEAPAADAATADAGAGQKRPEAALSFEARVAEKRAKIAHLEAAVANAEHAVEAYEKTPLAQAVVAVWEMLVREMLTEVAFAVHRSLATAATAKDAAEGKDKGNAEGNDDDDDDDDDDEAAVPAPRRGVPGPGPHSRTVCPNCQRGVPCSRFTLHLDKCLAHPGTRRTKQSARF